MALRTGNQFAPFFQWKADDHRLTEAEFAYLVDELMDIHLDGGWTWKWGRALQQIATCYPTRRLLIFSKPVFVGSTFAQAFDTITHEIAHAMTSGHRHDDVWRQTHQRIGGSGERTWKAHEAREFGDGYRVAAAKRKTREFIGVCPGCGDEWYGYERRIRVACGDCCKAHNGGKYSADYAIQWFEVVDGRRVSAPLPPKKSRW